MKKKALIFAALCCVSPFLVLCTEKTDRSASLHGYDLGGLTAGNSIEQALSGSVDFVIGELPMNPAQVDQAVVERGVRMLNLPTAIKAAVPCYNLPGVQLKLNFSPEILAGIFLGKITKWNDKEIAAANPGVRLPSTSIVLTQRTDEGGDTYAWTEYLSKTTASWRAAVGVTPMLMLPIPLSKEGPEGVAQLVKATANSIGFSDLWAAKKANLQLGRVRNRAGLFVDATPESMYAAVKGELPFLLKDYRASLTDAPGKAAYPICAFTWVIVPNTIPNAEKRQKITSFLKWLLTNGQNTTTTLSYGRLPQALVSCELHAVDGIH